MPFVDHQHPIPGIVPPQSRPLRHCGLRSVQRWHSSAASAKIPCIVPGGIRLVGELDVSTAPLLQATLAKAVGDQPVDIILDLADLRYLDSTGLSLFVTTSKRAQTSGRKLVLLNPQTSTRRLLEVTDLTNYFEVNDTAPG
jgi:anti-sigma B factor antagonist